MLGRDADGPFSIVRRLAFSDGTAETATFGSYGSVSVAERILSDRIDVIGIFEDIASEREGLEEVEFRIARADGGVVEGSGRARWTSELDAGLFEVLCEVSRDGAPIEAACAFSGNDYDAAAASLTALDLQRPYFDHGGYGCGLAVSAALIDSSPRAYGGDAARDLVRVLDDDAYARKLGEVGRAVRTGLFGRSEIKDVLGASDAEIDLAESVFERPSGYLLPIASGAPGEDAPEKRNAEARAATESQTASPKRDRNIRR